METMDKELKQKRAANIRLALFLAVVALGVLATFIWAVSRGVAG